MNTKVLLKLFGITDSSPGVVVEKEVESQALLYFHFQAGFLSILLHKEEDSLMVQRQRSSCPVLLEIRCRTFSDRDCVESF